MITPRRPAGFYELLPEEQLVFQAMLDIIRSTYELYGFSPIETPAIEYAEILLAKGGGETEKEMYQFQKGDNKLALHFDLTVPTARYTAEHMFNLTFPFRRYQIQKVWRAEKPQKGRMREFYQCDIDVIGSKSLLDDAEIPAAIYEVFAKFNQKFEIGDVVIHINNRKIWQGVLEHLGYTQEITDVLRLIDKLEKREHSQLKQEMLELGVTSQDVDTIFDVVHIQGSNQEKLLRLTQLGVENTIFQEGISELGEVLTKIYELGVPQESIELDLSITRGLDYYTGTVYETKLVRYPHFGSVCSGGRYDNLVSQYTHMSLPGVGMSIGLTRLFAQLIDEGILVFTAKTPAKVLIVTLTDQDQSKALSGAQQLRKLNIPVEVYPAPHKLGKQLKNADMKGIPYVVVVGVSEAKDGEVLLKDMKTGEQVLLNIEKIVSKIHQT